jgi:hypothetical protein
MLMISVFYPLLQASRLSKCKRSCDSGGDKRKTQHDKSNGTGGKRNPM